MFYHFNATTRTDGDRKPIAFAAFTISGIAKSVSDRLNGKPLWPWFVILALLCFLTEIALLRFWGRPALNE